MSEFTTGEKLSLATLNQKTVYIGAAVPATPYDGQVWVCTSSDPPLVKSYDLTNTRWQEHHEARYETVNSGQTPISGIYLNGTLCVAYDTQQSGTKLYAYANSSWRDMGGAITRVYPVGDINAFSIHSGDTTSLAVAARIDGVSGAIVTICSTNITPNNSGDYAVAFVGCKTYGETGTNATLRLRIGNTTVATKTITALYYPHSIASGRVVSNTSTNVCADVQFNASGRFYHCGVSLGTVVVKT